MFCFCIFRRSLGSVRVLEPIKVWDFDMNNGRAVKLNLAPTDTICVRSVCRNLRVKLVFYFLLINNPKLTFRENF
jgi:hypothetical protein